MSDMSLIISIEDCHKKSDTDSIVDISKKPLSPIRKYTDLIPDDCDIIPPTPIKCIKKKKLKKKKNVIHKQQEVGNNLQVEENYSTALNYEFDCNCKIKNTRTGTFDFNKPYIYQSIEEVLKYTENCFPKNNNIHIIGIHKVDTRDGHYLNCSRSKIRIALDLTIALKMPNEDELISVFGSVEFNKNGPVFVIKFFRQEVAITVKSYMENLRILRSFIPTEYFKTIKSSS